MKKRPEPSWTVEKTVTVGRRKWVVELGIGRTMEGIRCTSVLVFSESGDPEPVTSTLMRKIPFSSLAREAVEECVEEGRESRRKRAARAREVRKAIKKGDHDTLERIGHSNPFRSAVYQRSGPQGLLDYLEGEWTDPETGAPSRRFRKKLGMEEGPAKYDRSEVARVYRAADVEGRPPRKAVAEYFEISLSMAGKLIHDTRDKGLLGSTSPGEAGESTR